MAKLSSHDSLVDIATKIIYEFKNRDNNSPILSISYKSENDAVTSLDLFLQDRVKSILTELDPQVPILFEEGSKLGNPPDTCWIVDPLDGTSNYIQGLSPSAIAFAKVSGYQVLMSVVIDLATFDVYTAISSKGFKLNGKHVTQATHPKIKLLGASTGFLRHCTDSKTVPENWNIRIIGSQALQLCFVARGIIAANVSYEARAWDDAAGSLIIAESGGHYQHAHGDNHWSKLLASEVPLRSFAISSGLCTEEAQKLIHYIKYG